MIDVPGPFTLSVVYMTTDAMPSTADGDYLPDLDNIRLVGLAAWDSSESDRLHPFRVCCDDDFRQRQTSDRNVPTGLGQTIGLYGNKCHVLSFSTTTNTRNVNGDHC